MKTKKKLYDFGGPGDDLDLSYRPNFYKEASKPWTKEDQAKHRARVVKENPGKFDVKKDVPLGITEPPIEADYTPEMIAASLLIPAARFTGRFSGAKNFAADAVTGTTKSPVKGTTIYPSKSSTSLPDYMTPYISKKTTPPAKGEEIFESFLSPGGQKKALENRTIRYDEAGNVTNSNGFKSEIDWAKWNKEIPENTQLMQEYNAIEQTAKQNDTWMKNSDGSTFEGSPEQFIQQNSSNFKKAFPDGHTSAYRGSQAFDPTLSTSLRGKSENQIIFGAKDKAVAEMYATNGGYNLDHLFKDTGKRPEYFHPDKNTKSVYTGYEKDVNPGLYHYAIDKKPSLIGEGYNDSWHNVENKETLDWLKAQDGGKNYMNRLMYEKYKANRVKTDDMASYMVEKDIPVGVAKNTSDAYKLPSTDIIMSNPKLTKTKSLVYNNGMFDMNNPNIYKTVIPGVIAGNELLNSENQSMKKYGGQIKKKFYAFGSDSTNTVGAPVPVSAYTNKDGGTYSSSAPATGPKSNYSNYAGYASAVAGAIPGYMSAIELEKQGKRPEAVKQATQTSVDTTASMIPVVGQIYGAARGVGNYSSMIGEGDNEVITSKDGKVATKSSNDASQVFGDTLSGAFNPSQNLSRAGEHISDSSDPNGWWKAGLDMLLPTVGNAITQKIDRDEENKLAQEYARTHINYTSGDSSMKAYALGGQMPVFPNGVNPNNKFTDFKDSTFKTHKEKGVAITPNDEVEKNESMYRFGRTKKATGGSSEGGYVFSHILGEDEQGNVSVVPQGSKAPKGWKSYADMSRETMS